MKLKLLSITFLFGFLHAIPCTVYKITKNGKTFVGNNEDYWDANTRLWFEKGKAGEYGAMYVGQDNLVAQGGMNEKGLVFDGFSVQERQIKYKTGKLKFYPTLFKDVIKKCQNTAEVAAMLDKYDLSPLNGGMLLYVEKNGKYLVVEADTMMMGNEDNYLLSNFCPSQTSNVQDLNIPYYQKGRKLIMWIKRSLFLFLKCIFFFFFLHARRRVIYRHICLSLEKINSSWCSGQKRGEAVLPSRLQRGTTPLAASSPRSASQWPGAWGWF